MECFLKPSWEDRYSGFYPMNIKHAIFIVFANDEEKLDKLIISRYTDKKIWLHGRASMESTREGYVLDFTVDVEGR